MVEYKLKLAAFLLFLFVAVHTAALGKVTLPPLFADHMVLQRETSVAVWGRSNSANVVITPSWNNQPVPAAVTSDGSWKVVLKTPAAGGPYTLTFDDGDRLTISDILIGEVWICSGQSNMDMPVRGLSASDQVSNKAEILASASQPQIRLLKIPHTAAGTLENDTPARWQRSDTSTVNTFSAVGFMFARQLQAQLNVPIGVIHSAWSGTRIEPWMSPESLAPFNYPKPKSDTSKVTRTTGSALFNGMIGPLLGYAVKGVIWYQGESNLVQYADYANRMAALVDGWKKAWPQDKLSFYYVQIAPFDYGRINGKVREVPYLREAQEKAMSLIPDSYMVSTVDIGSKTTIHPADKQTVAGRLAQAALSRTYGLTNVPYENVRLESVDLKGRKAVIHVANAPNGLVSARHPTGFEVAGDDQVFYPATASVRSKKIRLRSPQVRQIRAVRYCFRDWAPGTIHNRDGLPLLPFRTDAWPIFEHK